VTSGVQTKIPAVKQGHTNQIPSQIILLIRGRYTKKTGPWFSVRSIFLVMLFEQQCTGLEQAFQVLIPHEQVGPFARVAEFGIIRCQASLYHGPKNIPAFVEAIIVEETFEYTHGFLHFLLSQQQDPVEQFFLFKKQ
jgi:hypothetical protein